MISSTRLTVSETTLAIVQKAGRNLKRGPGAAGLGSISCGTGATTGSAGAASTIGLVPFARGKRAKGDSSVLASMIFFILLGSFVLEAGVVIRPPGCRRIPNSLALRHDIDK